MHSVSRYRTGKPPWCCKPGEKSRAYAQSLDGLAQMYFQMHDYARAETLYQQAVSIKKEVLGERHPDYALSINNLAGVYDAIGDFSDQPIPPLSETPGVRSAARAPLLGEHNGEVL